MDSDHYIVESGTPVPLGLRLLCKLIKHANSLVRRKDGTLNRKLAELINKKAEASRLSQKGVSTQDVVIDSKTGVWLRIFLPETNSASKMPILFHFHGGGFALLSADSMFYDIFCRRLSRRCQAVVLSVNYRKAPEHRFPTAYDDCFSALKWLQQNWRLYLPRNADLSQCILAGDSAGANIVHHVGCKAAKENLTPIKIVGHLLLCPFFGGEGRTSAERRLTNAPLVSTENTDWHWKAYLPKGANRDHPACNVFGPNALDISELSLPPSVVIIGEYDPLKDWQINYAHGLRKAGKQAEILYYKGGIHSFHLFFMYEPSSQALSDLKEKITKFVER